MEKTPRRSSVSSAPVSSGPPSSSSVVVDPSSQVPGPSSSRSGGSAAAAARRKAETTLVLKSRRVDTLRRQVSERHRAQIAGRRRQVILWALAGAGAVLLGGWLATRLSPARGSENEAPLVLGRTEADGAVTPPPAPAQADSEGATASAQARGTRRSATRAAGATPASAAAPDSEDSGAIDPFAVPDSDAEPPGERSPDEPKTVGDWGDGFDRTSTQGKSGSRRGAANGDAVNLDDLPTE